MTRPLVGAPRTLRARQDCGRDVAGSTCCRVRGEAEDRGDAGGRVPAIILAVRPPRPLQIPVGTGASPPLPPRESGSERLMQVSEQSEPLNGPRGDAGRRQRARGQELRPGWCQSEEPGPSRALSAPCPPLSMWEDAQDTGWVAAPSSIWSPCDDCEGVLNPRAPRSPQAPAPAPQQEARGLKRQEL